jgi:hypothetical protein
VGERYLEVRYEQLVVEPERELARVCDFAGLRFEPAMLDYAGSVDVSAKPHQRSLTRPPTPGLRDWRRELSPADADAFSAVAGDVLLELGYEPARPPTLSGRARLASYGARVAAWRLASRAVQRSPLWRRRHAPVA